MNQQNIDLGQYYGAQQNTNMKLVSKKEYLFIDSRYVTHQISGNVDFIVQFNTNTPNQSSFPVFRNVASVELKGISGNFNNEDYIILDIPELNNRLKSNVPSVNQCFCTIFCEDNKPYIKGSDFDHKIVYFNPPLSQLSQLHVKLKRVNGTSDNNILIDDMRFVSMIFEVTTIHNTIY